MRHIPAGVDPGWDNNPGKFRMDNLRKLWDNKLGDATPEQKRIAVEDMTRQPIFKTIAEGKAPYDNNKYNADPANKQRGNYAVPVAALPEAAAKLLETDAGLVKLSVADGAKQAANHADLTAEDYRRIQQALDAAKAYWLSDPVQRQVHIFADLADFSVRLIIRKARSTGEVF